MEKRVLFRSAWLPWVLIAPQLLIIGIFFFLPAGQAILQRLLAGESCALVTDAGTPAISDPGEDLVRLCAENGVEVLSIPGCCAAVNALAVSGLPTGRFTFEGFITVNKKSRR